MEGSRDGDWGWGMRVCFLLGEMRNEKWGMRNE